MQNGKHVGWKAVQAFYVVVVGTAVVAVVVVVVNVVVADLHCVSDARAWIRQVPCYVTCARAVCVVCR